MLDSKIEVRVKSEDKAAFIKRCQDASIKYQDEIRKFIKGDNDEHRENT